jgi:hypothetical protein
MIFGSLGVNVSSAASWIQEPTSLLDSSPGSPVSQGPSELKTPSPASIR